MAKKISELPLAAPLDGDELIEVVQGGVNKRTPAGSIGGVQSVNGKTGTVVITAADLGAVSAVDLESGGVGKGAAMVGFTATGTGAVTRTAQDKLREVVSVKDFGAVGDGVTDDTGAIKAALDYVAGRGGGQVLCPHGTYIARALAVPSNVNLVGEGWGSVLKHPAMDLNAGASKVIHVNEAENVRIMNLRVDGNKANITNGDINNVEGISVQKSKNVRVINVNCVDCYSEGVDFDDSEDCYAESIYAENCGGMAVHLSENSVRCHTINSVAVNCGWDSNRPGFDVFTTASKCSIENCVSVNCYVGFNINGSDSQVSNIRVYGTSDGGSGDGSIGVDIGGSRNEVNGVRVFDASNVGVRISGDDNDVSGIFVKDNLAENGVRVTGDRNKLNGVRVSGGVSTQLLVTSTASDNQIGDIALTGSGATGIQISSTTSRTRVNGGLVDSPTSTGVFVQAADSDLFDVTVVSAGGDGFSTNAANTSFINCRSSGAAQASFRTQGTNAALIGCRSVLPGTVHLSDSGTGTAVRTCDWPAADERGGKAIFDADGVAVNYAIPHGLGATPSFVQLTPGSADTVSEQFWVESAGPVQINIKYANPPTPGSQNIVFYWRANSAARG